MSDPISETSVVAPATTDGGDGLSQFALPLPSSSSAAVHAGSASAPAAAQQPRESPRASAATQDGPLSDPQAQSFEDGSNSRSGGSHQLGGIGASNMSDSGSQNLQPNLQQQQQMNTAEAVGSRASDGAITPTPSQQQQQQQPQGTGSGSYPRSGSAANSGVPATETQKLYVRNLPPNMTEDTLRRYFEPFGNIIALLLCNERAGTGFCAYITYATPAEARVALRATCGQTPFHDPRVGAVPLNVRFAESLESRNARLSQKQKKGTGTPASTLGGGSGTSNSMSGMHGSGGPSGLSSLNSHGSGLPPPPPYSATAAAMQGGGVVQYGTPPAMLAAGPPQPTQHVTLAPGGGYYITTSAVPPPPPPAHHHHHHHMGAPMQTVMIDQNGQIVHAAPSPPPPPPPGIPMFIAPNGVPMVPQQPPGAPPMQYVIYHQPGIAAPGQAMLAPPQQGHHHHHHNPQHNPQHNQHQQQMFVMQQAPPPHAHPQQPHQGVQQQPQQQQPQPQPPSWIAPPHPA